MVLSVGQEPDIPDLIDFMQSGDELKIINAARYLQHLCYSKESVKDKVRYLEQSVMNEIIFFFTEVWPSCSMKFCRSLFVCLFFLRLTRDVQGSEKRPENDLRKKVTPNGQNVVPILSLWFIVTPTFDFIYSLTLGKVEKKKNGRPGYIFVKVILNFTSYSVIES